MYNAFGFSQNKLSGYYFGNSISNILPLINIFNPLSLSTSYLSNPYQPQLLWVSLFVIFVKPIYLCGGKCSFLRHMSTRFAKRKLNAEYDQCGVAIKEIKRIKEIIVQTMGHHEAWWGITHNSENSKILKACLPAGRFWFRQMGHWWGTRGA